MHGRFGRRGRWARKPRTGWSTTLKPRVESLKVAPYTDPSSEMGPVITRQSLDRIHGLIAEGIDAGADLLVDGRDIRLQGYEDGFFIGGCLFDRVTTDMSIYRQEIFGPVLSVVRAEGYEDALGMVNDHEYGNGAAIFTRDGDTARDFFSRAKIRHGRRERADPGAGRLPFVRPAGSAPCSATITCTAWRASASHEAQDHDHALAGRHQGRRRVRLPRRPRDEKLSASGGAVAGTSGQRRPPQPPRDRQDRREG